MKKRVVPPGNTTSKSGTETVAPRAGIPGRLARDLGWRLAMSATAVLALAGCATPVPSSGWQPPAGAVGAPMSSTPGRYDYSGTRVKLDGQVMDPDVALGTISHHDALAVGQISPDNAPIAGSLRIVLPDHDRLRPLAMQALRQPGGGAVEFAAERARLELHLLADSVVRRRPFNSVTLVEQNNTVTPDAAGADYLLWFMVRSIGPNNVGPWQGVWQMKRAGAATAEVVTADPGSAFGPARLLSFVDSVRLAATRQSGGAVVASAEGSRRTISSGSGIAIDAHGHVLTNNHVVASCPGLRVTDASGTSAAASVVAADATSDLALLKTERRWPGWASFRDSSGLRPGEPVVVTGFPLTGVVSPEMAVTTGSLTALAGVSGDRRQLQFSAPIQPGNSGGPVLDETGRVVGVASSMLNSLVVASVIGVVPQNVNFAVKTSTVRDFLTANQVALDGGSSHQAMNAAAIGDLARRFTLKIECQR